MDEQFGAEYAQSVAKDYVLAGLDGRTIAKALADGEDVKAIWRAVCAAFDVPERLRLCGRSRGHGGRCGTCCLSISPGGTGRSASGS